MVAELKDFIQKANELRQKVDLINAVYDTPALMQVLEFHRHRHELKKMCVDFNKLYNSEPIKEFLQEPIF